MGLKKGQTNNPNGRPKGTPNKISAETRRFISELIHSSRTDIKKSLKALERDDSFKYLTIIERLMSYAIPKMQEIDVNAQVEAEYSELKKMLEICPDEFLDEITDRIVELQKVNKQ